MKKDVSSCVASDLHQGTEQEREGDNERVGLMEDDSGPPDFMDLTDPFAPPNLGTRGFMTTTCSADDVLLGEHKSASKSSMWGRLPLVVTEQKKAARTEARRASGSVKPKSSAKKTSLGPGEVERRARITGSISRVPRVTSIRRAKSGESLSRSYSRSRRGFGLSSGGCRKAVANDRAADRTGTINGKSFGRLARTGSKTRATKPYREDDCDRDGLDVEEALLAQRLLMKLNLAPGS